MSDDVLYLYGIVPPSADVRGLTGVEEDRGVFLVRVEDVACAASLVPAEIYQSIASAPDSSERMEWLAPRAWRHHQVLRDLHANAAVVPLKFGTLCDRLTDAEDILHRLREPSLALLTRVARRDEWTLRYDADQRAIAASLVAGDPRLRDLERQVSELPAGRAYFAAKQLEQATRTRVHDYFDHIEDAVRAQLSAQGVPIADTTASSGSTGREMALLIDRATFTEVEELLRRTEMHYRDCSLAFELVGPWPPYSFTADLSIDAGAVN